jgi:hypothetical protein
MAEPTVKRGEILIEIVVGVGVAEADLQEQPAGLAEEPLMQVGGGHREHGRIDCPCLAVAAAFPRLAWRMARNLVRDRCWDWLEFPTMVGTLIYTPCDVREANS